MDENLIRTLDLRYCHPATAGAIDREVDVLLQYAEDAKGMIETAENECNKASDTLDRVREMVHDIALQMDRKGSFNTMISDDHAEDLCDYADKIREAID